MARRRSYALFIASAIFFFCGFAVTLVLPKSAWTGSTSLYGQIFNVLPDKICPSYPVNPAPRCFEKSHCERVRTFDLRALSDIFIVTACFPSDAKDVALTLFVSSWITFVAQVLYLAAVCIQESKRYRAPKGYRFANV
ncbi:unnamed protein product, partial [Mesorhabditis spiculigera]